MVRVIWSNVTRHFIRLTRRTRETLASGNLLSVINVLMQLRKVCNHPNMFEVRPTISPFRMDGLLLRTTTLVYDMLNYDPFNVGARLSVRMSLVLFDLECYVFFVCSTSI